MKLTIFLLFLFSSNFALSQEKTQTNTTQSIKKERHETIIIKKKTYLGETPKTVIDTTITIDTITILPPKPIKYWKKGGNIGINVTQTGLKNWVAGGEDAFSGIAIFNVFANFKKDKKSWNNMLDIQHGLTNTPSLGTQKSIDILKFLSKYNYQLKKNLHFSTQLDFLSQIAKGYSYPNTETKISDFMAPGYLCLAIGLEHIPNKHLNLFFSPVAGKLTFVMDDYLSGIGAFGVEPGKNVFNEFGATFKALYNKEVMKNVKFQTSLMLFSSYNNKFGNIDINWDSLLFFKISKYINAVINTGLIYDDDIDYIDENGVNHGPKIQFKEIIGVGFSYNFGKR